MRERDWFDIRRASLNERSWTSLPSEVISGCHRHSSLHPASLPSALHPPSSAPPYHRHGHATTNVIPFLSLFPVARYPVARCPLPVARCPFLRSHPPTFRRRPPPLTAPFRDRLRPSLGRVSLLLVYTASLLSPFTMALCATN